MMMMDANDEIGGLSTIRFLCLLLHKSWAAAKLGHISGWVSIMQ